MTPAGQTIPALSANYMTFPTHNIAQSKFTYIETNLDYFELTRMEPRFQLEHDQIVRNLVRKSSF